MREQGECRGCKYPIEREIWERPHPTELHPYGREKFFKYYVDGQEVFACPGCKGILPLNPYQQQKAEAYMPAFQKKNSVFAVSSAVKMKQRESET